MELGATYCCPSGTGIEDGDPLKQFYISTQLGVAVGKSIKSGNFLSTQRDLVGTHKSECKLCDPDGVSSVFFDISDRISDSSKQINLSAEIVSAMSGHSAIPMPPPKKAKREEVIAVGVIRLEDTNSNNNSWLMVKRPPEGLLAGQWEFPSKCLWTSSDKEKKAKSSSSKSADVQVPCIDASVRSAELDSYLYDILHAPNSAAKTKKNAILTKRVQVNDPIVHVFSHVCHTMWVEHCRVNGNQINTEKRWKLRDGREAGWFTEDDMLSVGITSGVRKVLALTGAQK
jgi:A/G-specific adenine glycosylase